MQNALVFPFGRVFEVLALKFVLSLHGATLKYKTLKNHRPLLK